MKYLQITFSNGEIWNIPAKLIAEERAEYYALHDAHEDGYGKNDVRYRMALEQEVTAALENTSLITDWAANNMNWSDVKDRAKLVIDKTKIDYKEKWTNADMEVIEE